MRIADSTCGLTRTGALRAGDVLSYRVCEDVTEALVYLMAVFSPWAFGTTQPWSIWIMNIAGYSLGALLIGKLAVRRLKGYRPPRWDDDGRSKIEDLSACEHAQADGRSENLPDSHPPTSFRLRVLARREVSHLLAALTALILGYCLISAVNARSTYHAEQLSFEYHHYLKWLPHSFDSGRSWFAFWSYLGLACSFWAVRDWLLGKSTGEERAEHQKPGRGGFDSPLLPTRLRRLLWVLAVNGGLLGLEGIVQRLEGSGRLLFLVKPRVNPDALSQFGPYAYRGNAAAYFNLLWPACLGFWWTLHRQAERIPKRASPDSSGLAHRHHLLLVCTTLMAASPIISTSRGGALITVGLMALAGLLMVGSHFFWKQPGRVRIRGQKADHVVSGQWSVVSGRWSEVRGQRADHTTTGLLDNGTTGSEVSGQSSLVRGQKSEAHLPSSNFHLPSPTLVLLAFCFAAVLGLGYAFGWKALKPRMAQLGENFEGREQMYDAARPMAADYPLFGTGPGTFESVFQLYRISTDTYWPAQLHNDWLETRITFGWLGSGLIGFAFVGVILRWFAPGGIHGGRRFICLLWLGLAGCLAHARFDFPFQIHSIVLLFLVQCAMVSNLSKR